MMIAIRLHPRLSPPVRTSTLMVLLGTLLLLLPTKAPANFFHPTINKTLFSLKMILFPLQLLTIASLRPRNHLRHHRQRQRQYLPKLSTSKFFVYRLFHLFWLSTMHFLICCCCCCCYSPYISAIVWVTLHLFYPILLITIASWSVNVLAVNLLRHRLPIPSTNRLRKTPFEILQPVNHPPMASTLAVVVVANAVRIFPYTETLLLDLVLRPVPIFASLIQMMRNKHRRRPIHLFVRTHCFHRRRHRLLPNSLVILAPQLLLLLAPSVSRTFLR